VSSNLHKATQARSPWLCPHLVCCDDITCVER